MSYAHGFPSSMYPKEDTRTFHFLEGGSWNLRKLFAWIFNCYYGKKHNQEKRKRELPLLTSPSYNKEFHIIYSTFQFDIFYMFMIPFQFNIN